MLAHYFKFYKKKRANSVQMTLEEFFGFFLFVFTRKTLNLNVSNGLNYNALNKCYTILSFSYIFITDTRKFSML